jgi:hypothetical protein
MVASMQAKNAFKACANGYACGEPDMVASMQANNAFKACANGYACKTAMQCQRV